MLLKSYTMNKEIIQTLKILPIDSICPFEWNSNISADVEIDDILKIRHPFLVTPLPHGKYLLLEASTEFYNLKQAGVTQVPVQIVQNSQISIVQKTIGIYSFDEHDLNEIFELNASQITSEVVTNDTDDGKDVCLSYEDKQFAITSIPKHIVGCPISVSKIFSHFEKNGGYRMIQHQGSLSDSLMKVHRFVATVEIPQLTFSNLADAVKSNNLFPPNIIEVQADIRILYIDFPVSTLLSDNLITEKEVFLRELILLREQAEKTSSYQGKVYLLNR